MASSAPTPHVPAPPKYQPLTDSSAHLKRRKFASSAFATLCFSVTLLAFGALLWILLGVWKQGSPHLNLNFLRQFTSELDPKNAGILPGLIGSLWVLGFTALFAVPVGIGAAIFLQEYGGDNKFARFVQVNVANLAGVPSIVYGMLGLAVFVRIFHMERSVMAAGLTLGLLVLPIIIIAAQEALRGVPSSLREGSYALGASRWQTISRQVFPVALPGILTGIILAISRAIGETAPLIVVGAAAFVTFLPRSPTDAFTVLPIQIFNWSSNAKTSFQDLAAAGIIVLLAVLLSLNAIAIFLRHRYNTNL